MQYCTCYRSETPLCTEEGSLSSVIKKDFSWNKEAEDAFYKIKEMLTGGLQLFHPDLNRTFVLSTDSSKHSIAGVLS